MDNTQEAGMIPNECFAKKNSKCMDATMTNTFCADVSKVLHHPASIEGCNLGVCYDRTAHPITSLGMEAWGIPIPAIKVLLNTQRIMKFCLQTGFGESKEMFGGPDAPL